MFRQQWEEIKSPKSILIILLCIDLLLILYYYNRLSDYAQDNMSFAYERVFVFFEMYQVVAALFVIAVFAVPIIFYIRVSVPIGLVNSGKVIIYLCVIVSNILIGISEVAMMHNALEDGRNNSFGQQSTFMTQVFSYGLSMILALFHQVTSYGVAWKCLEAFPRMAHLIEHINDKSQASLETQDQGPTEEEDFHAETSITVTQDDT